MNGNVDICDPRPENTQKKLFLKKTMCCLYQWEKFPLIPIGNQLS